MYMHNIRARYLNIYREITASFYLQLKQTITNSGSLGFLISAIPTAAVMAWIVNKSSDTGLTTYIMISVPLMWVSNGMIFNIGWSLNNEIYSGTLEFALISRTSMIINILGKALGHMAFVLITSILSWVTIILVSTRSPSVAEIWPLIISIILTMGCIIIVSLFFAPLMTLARGRGGFFNAFMPLVTVLSGFAFPIKYLPPVLNIMSRLVPTSWAMDIVRQSIEGTRLWNSYIISWIVCILIACVWLLIIYWMFNIVEKRVRVSGNLGIY